MTMGVETSSVVCHDAMSATLHDVYTESQAC